MNMPLWNAFPTSWFAIPTSWLGSAVDAMTKSTGKSPPPGSGGGTVEITRIPGLLDRPPEPSIWICCVVFLRSLQGLVTIRPKPPLGNTICNEVLDAGNDGYERSTSD